MEPIGPQIPVTPAAQPLAVGPVFASGPGPQAWWKKGIHFITGFEVKKGFPFLKPTPLAALWLLPHSAGGIGPNEWFDPWVPQDWGWEESAKALWRGTLDKEWIQKVEDNIARLTNENRARGRAEGAAWPVDTLTSEVADFERRVQNRTYYFPWQWARYEEWKLSLARRQGQNRASVIQPDRQFHTVVVPPQSPVPQPVAPKKDGGAAGIQQPEQTDRIGGAIDQVTRIDTLFRLNPPDP